MRNMITAPSAVQDADFEKSVPLWKRTPIPEYKGTEGRKKPTCMLNFTVKLPILIAWMVNQA